MTDHPVRLGSSPSEVPSRLGTSEGLDDQSEWYSVGLDWCKANRRKAVAKNGTVIIMEDRDSCMNHSPISSFIILSQ